MNKKFMKNVGLTLGVLLMGGTVVGNPISEPASVEAASVVKYKANYMLNINETASPWADSIGIIPQGKEMIYLGTSGGWYKIQYGKIIGYVGAKYVTKVTTPPVVAPKPPTTTQTVYTTTSSLNLRTGASTKHKVITTIPKAKVVKMVSYGKSWSKVTYGTKTGYVSSSYLKKTVVTVPKEETFKAKKLTTTTSTHLYSATTSGKKSLVVIPKGKVVTSSSKLSGFYKVTYSGKTGWVTGSHLK